MRADPAAEASYVDCLLTALARGTAASVTLTSGAPLPDPARLTTDAMDARFIAGETLDLGRLRADRVVTRVLELAGFRRFHLARREGQIRATLAAHAGAADTDATFRVQRLERPDGVAVEITRLTA